MLPALTFDHQSLWTCLYKHATRCVSGHLLLLVNYKLQFNVHIYTQRERMGDSFSWKLPCIEVRPLILLIVKLENLTILNLLCKIVSTGRSFTAFRIFLMLPHVLEFYAPQIHMTMLLIVHFGMVQKMEEAIGKALPWKYIILLLTEIPIVANI